MINGPSLATVNPYEVLTLPADRETRYVKLQLSHLSVRELTRLMLPNVPAWAYVLVAKAVRSSVCSQYGHDPLDWDVIDWHEAPVACGHALQRHAHELSHHAFEPVFAYRIPCVGNWEAYSFVFADARGRCWATWSWIRVGRQPKQFLSIGTILRDRSVLVTTNAARGITAPPHIKTRYHARRPLATLIASHQNWLSPLPAGVCRDWPVSELAGLLRENKQRSFNYYRARSIWVPMSGADVARVDHRLAVGTDIT